MTAVRLEPLATPTGVLVYDGPAHAPGWYETRRSGITATDLAKILDLSQYGTARHVWMDKLGLTADEDAESEAARWGTVLEEPVAAEWAHRHDCEVVPVGILAHRDHRWALASLDRIVLDCPDGQGPCGLEVKTRSAFVAGKWRDDVPDDVLAQVMWGLHVTGLGHMHVAALIGGQRLESYRVDRDDDVIAYLRGHAENLWGLVQAGQMPECAPTAALGRLLDSLHETRDGDTVVDEDTAEALLADYRDAAAAEKEAVAARERAKVAVIAALGAGQRLVVEDQDGVRPVFSYDARSKTSVNVTKARGDAALWAALEEAGAVKVSRYRQMSVKETGK